MYYIGTKTDITEDPEPNPHIHIYQILLEKYQEYILKHRTSLGKEFRENWIYM